MKRTPIFLPILSFQTSPSVTRTNLISTFQTSCIIAVTATSSPIPVLTGAIPASQISFVFALNSAIAAVPLSNSASSGLEPPIPSSLLANITFETDTDREAVDLHSG
ncbi:hypothetical protein FRB95_002312 [Tulasnella sp. JGI-2019a]|nr:hypothetical protein FRB93_002116 [Tulasnella sp. JGI-2019a]KAG9021366.1 hypothetical protein FRB95_002312 [Tulasnella sp. JGI-2019a]